jgi:citrate synthase
MREFIMSEQQTVYSNDLAGVVVGETAISDVDGEAGLLSYRGIDINDLVGVPYLHVVWMVLFGEWPNEQQKSRLKAFMCKHSKLTHCPRKSYWAWARTRNTACFWPPRSVA